ncbi:MAG TPA: RagB/SusD family nutrient uptake outer membrane protein [Longimicrobium sp.]|jgi:hypothetical protein|uniref:RagB/SusD family nutrient uptake outer membrane protein n=1 Tax=Longimicrobium sp. TaxID=2029185 RepID=UPI002ED8CB90
MNFATLSRRARTWVPRGAALAAIAASAAACDLDLTDPNAPGEDEVLNSPQLVLTTAIGLQAQYAENVHIFVRAPALLTDEWGTRPIALEADRSLVVGNIDPGYGVVSDPFAAAYRIARTADLLIEAAPRVQLGTELRVGTTALARTIKAMAIGNLTTQYQELPVNFDTAGAPPVPRDQVRDSVIAMLELARAEVGTLTDAQLIAFNNAVNLSSAGLTGGTSTIRGISLRNTINAMLARYYLFDGQYQQAIDAAARVNLAVPSVITYPNPGVNPIFNYGFSLNYVGTRKSFFTEAETRLGGDKRPAYWANRGAGVAGVPDSVFAFRRYGGRNDEFPLYLPDEMRLIQAEAYARLNQLAPARALINAVRTQCTSTVDEPTACFSGPLTDAELATQAQVLTQILYERRYELYAQGLRLEDVRRLREFTPKRPTADFLPYPASECQRNPNAGCA